MTETRAFVDISSRSADELAEKYVALWNEPDADRRRRMIAELWAEDGRHILQPPQEIRAIAAQPGIAMTAILKAQGYEEMAARAASVYEHWVGSEGLSFRARDDADRLGDVASSTGRRSPRTARCSQSGSASSSSPPAAGSSATTRSSSHSAEGAHRDHRRRTRHRRP